jgi:hypothetical protein
MRDLAAHQGAAVAELIEWWEDLHDCSTGSQLVSLVVPPGWGRSTVLAVLAARIGADEARLGAVLRLAGREAPDGLAVQIAWLRGVVEDQGCLPQVQRALGLDRTESVVEAGLDALGLFGLVTGLGAHIAGLPASLMLNAAASARDRAEAGQLASVARVASGIASYSKSLPVAVLIDDAELLDPRLVERLVFGLLDRVQSNVLAVVATTPAAPVLGRFNPTERYGPRWGTDQLDRCRPDDGRVGSPTTHRGQYVGLATGGRRPFGPPVEELRRHLGCDGVAGRGRRARHCGRWRTASAAR